MSAAASRRPSVLDSPVSRRQSGFSSDSRRPSIDPSRLIPMDKLSTCPFSLRDVRTVLVCGGAWGGGSLPMHHPLYLTTLPIAPRLMRAYVKPGVHLAFHHTLIELHLYYAPFTAPSKRVWRADLV